MALYGGSSLKKISKPQNPMAPARRSSICPWTQRHFGS